jgi:hypothetical protein
MEPQPQNVISLNSYRSPSAPGSTSASPKSPAGAEILDWIAARNKARMRTEDPYYQAKVNGMHMAELLEEMVAFHEKRSGKTRLSLTLMVRGRILFSALEAKATTRELRLLASSNRRHLEHEITLSLRADQAQV